MKICKKCNIEKEEIYFSKNQSKCKMCDKQYSEDNKQSIIEKNKKYYQENKEEFLKYQKQYSAENKDHITKYKKEYSIKNKEYIKAWRKQYHNDNKDILNENTRKYKQENKEYIKKCQKEYSIKNKESIKEYKKQYRIKNRSILNEKNNNKKKNDPVFKIRHIISNSILKMLKSVGFSKNNKSSTKYLQFTSKQLKEYLESLFEPWMNWNNQGVYRPNNWNDNDSSTWKWQIDHIIPHSTFKYTSMEDQSFKDCWALSNLRPYSAKQNILDGTSRIRHKEIYILNYDI